MKNWRKESALTFFIFACFHCFFDLRKWVVGKKSIKFFRAFKMELYLASIQKIRTLSFLQFFLKFKILASVFDVAPWFFALEQFCHICVKIFFLKISPARHSASKSCSKCHFEGSILNFKKNWRKESALIFWIEAR